MSKTISEINEKISRGAVRVVRADEMTDIVRAVGPEKAAEEVDVVTTGTFGAMCSSGVWLNFGHTDPPIKMSSLQLNDVEAYCGVAAVDAYLGAAQPSRNSIRYGGAHVIEDLLRGKSVLLRAVSYGTDCYPRKKIVGRITLEDLNTAQLSNPRNAYQRYAAAANTSERTLHTYMGKLLPKLGNVTYSGAGELSPLANDPRLETIGIGTRIFLGGAEGYVVSAGTQHDPENRFATLMVQGDLKKMSPEYLRAASFPSYGSTLYVGLGVPIPILDEQIAAAGVADEDIVTEVLDYGVAARNRPVITKVSYADLKSGAINIDGCSVPTSPLSSYYMARTVADRLKVWIKRGEFHLSSPVEPLSLESAAGPMKLRYADDATPPEPFDSNASDKVVWDESKCVQCGLCLSFCPRNVFQRDAEWKIQANVEECRPCGRCRDVCPTDAIQPPDGK